MKTLTRRGALASTASLVALPALAASVGDAVPDAGPDPELVALARRVDEAFAAWYGAEMDHRQTIERARADGVPEEELAERTQTFDYGLYSQLQDAFNQAGKAMQAALRARGKLVYIVGDFAYLGFTLQGDGCIDGFESLCGINTKSDNARIPLDRIGGIPAA